MQVAGTGLAKLLSVDAGRAAGHDANGFFSLLYLHADAHSCQPRGHCIKPFTNAIDEGDTEDDWHDAPYSENGNETAFPTDTDTENTDGSAELSDNSATTTLLKKNPPPSRLAPLVTDSDGNDNEVLV